MVNGDTSIDDVCVYTFTAILSELVLASVSDGEDRSCDDGRV